MTQLTCRLCGNTAGNVSYMAREMVFGNREEFEYFQCARCECLQIAAVPADLERHYPTDYYAFGTLSGPRLGRLELFLKRKRAIHHLQRRNLIGGILASMFGPPNIPEYLRRAGVKVDDRIVSIGSGKGPMLLQLRSEGFTSLTGTDPFIEKDVHYPNGVVVYKKYFRDLEGEFDVILLSHSLEHMPNPAQVFGLLNQKLSPGGVVIIRIPTVSSYAWKHYGVNWFQLDPPRHLFLHSTRSIELLAEKAGLRVDEIVYDSTGKQFWASEQYVRDIHYTSERSYRRNPKESIFTDAQIEEFERRAEELNRRNQGDQACFYLRKLSVDSPRDAVASRPRYEQAGQGT